MCKSRPHLSLVGRCGDTPDLFPESRYSMHTCSILPARDIGAGEDICVLGCMIPNGAHHDIHVCQDKNGTYHMWYDDYDCGCCSWDTYDRCFVHSTITDAFELDWLLDGRMSNEFMPPRLVKQWCLQERMLLSGSEHADTCWDCGEHIDHYDTCWIRWEVCLYSNGLRRITAEYRHDICPGDDMMEDQSSGSETNNAQYPIAA